MQQGLIRAGHALNTYLGSSAETSAGTDATKLRRDGAIHPRSEPTTHERQFSFTGTEFHRRLRHDIFTAGGPWLLQPAERVKLFDRQWVRSEEE